ncbi:phospholipase A1-like [Macrosteles quadrilineatus]|uniref:phospholipase A1-like n=1 Tax=Macrosteles quadrilineatus TaxID=74068 RepID=UPI0023E164F9|nr:phospholipase A1-like [Macrosteles quadrilineatus]
MALTKATFWLLVLVSSLQISKAEWSAEGRVGLRFYTEGPNVYIEEPIESGVNIFSHNHFNSTLPVVILIHGMDASVDCIFVEESVKAMYFRGLNKNFNIIALNLPELLAVQSVMDKYLYTTAVNSKIAGVAVGKFLNNVIKQKFTTPDKIHVVGYSMGAQVSGYLAREVKAEHGLINFIMGLDPAGIGFTPSTFASWYTGLTHVTADDAQYVHFVHCNSLGWGTLHYQATANFVFNGGNFQPGCATSKNLGCSHNRVPFYFIDSVLYPENFVAKKCDSWKSFTSCQCESEETVFVTFPPVLGAKGTYQLKTNSETPFGLSEAGVKCEKDTTVLEVSKFVKSLQENNKKIRKQGLKLNGKYVKTSSRKVHKTAKSPISFRHRTVDKYIKLHPKKPATSRSSKNKVKHSAKLKKQSKTHDISMHDMVEHMHHNVVDK